MTEWPTFTRRSAARLLSGRPEWTDYENGSANGRFGYQGAQDGWTARSAGRLVLATGGRCQALLIRNRGAGSAATLNI
jgi:hypothetical protein